MNDDEPDDKRVGVPLRSIPLPPSSEYNFGTKVKDPTWGLTLCFMAMPILVGIVVFFIVTTY